MTKTHHKSSRRLRKTKTMRQRQVRRFKRTLNTKLTQFDDDLCNLIQSHTFFHHAIIHLGNEELAPESWVTGAIITQRWLQQSADTLTQQLQDIRQWVNG